jgi:hypothetical protein
LLLFFSFFFKLLSLVLSVSDGLLLVLFQYLILDCIKLRHIDWSHAERNEVLFITLTAIGYFISDDVFDELCDFLVFNFRHWLRLSISYCLLLELLCFHSLFSPGLFSLQGSLFSKDLLNSSKDFSFGELIR